MQGQPTSHRLRQNFTHRYMSHQFLLVFVYCYIFGFFICFGSSFRNDSWFKKIIRQSALRFWCWTLFLVFLNNFWLLFYRNGEMSLTLELLRMETDREPMYWPFNARSTGLISAVPHDCPKAIKKATTNTTADPGALVNNNNNNNNNASTKNSVLNGLSQHKRHSYCKYTFLSCILLPIQICTL